MKTNLKFTKKPLRAVLRHCGGSMAEWSARQTRNPAVPGWDPALTTTWICFTMAQSSDIRLCL